MSADATLGSGSLAGVSSSWEIPRRSFRLRRAGRRADSRQLDINTRDHSCQFPTKTWRAHVNTAAGGAAPWPWCSGEPRQPPRPTWRGSMISCCGGHSAPAAKYAPWRTAHPHSSPAPPLHLPTLQYWALNVCTTLLTTLGGVCKRCGFPYTSCRAKGCTLC